MRQNDIESILKSRVAVYKAGALAGSWKDIDLPSTSAMMDYLFIKSGHVATYNFVLEQMHNEHDFLPSGAYSLFKLPPQIEKELLEYLKSNKIDVLQMVDDANAYLKTLNTIATDYCIGEVCIGTFSMNEIDNILRLCASHYLHSFENHVKSFPYFE